KPTQSKAPQKTTAPSKPSKKSSSKTGKVQAKKPRRVAARPSGGQAPPPPSTMTAPGTVRTYSRPVPSATPDLPGVLPTPEIAADPGAYHQVNTVAMPQTRLISPAATAQDNSGQLLLVAAAAGVAGAVGAPDPSGAARALRLRRTTPSPDPPRRSPPAAPPNQAPPRHPTRPGRPPAVTPGRRASRPRTFTQ